VLTASSQLTQKSPPGLPAPTDRTFPPSPPPPPHPARLGSLAATSLTSHGPAVPVRVEGAATRAPAPCRHTQSGILGVAETRARDLARVVPSPPPPCVRACAFTGILTQSALLAARYRRSTCRSMRYGPVSGYKIRLGAAMDRYNAYLLTHT
jgi:hypothetical protein